MSHTSSPHIGKRSRRSWPCTLRGHKAYQGFHILQVIYKSNNCWTGIHSYRTMPWHLQITPTSTELRRPLPLHLWKLLCAASTFAMLRLVKRELGVSVLGSLSLKETIGRTEWLTFWCRHWSGWLRRLSSWIWWLGWLRSWIWWIGGLSSWSWWRYRCGAGCSRSVGRLRLIWINSVSDAVKLQDFAYFLIHRMQDFRYCRNAVF